MIIIKTGRKMIPIIRLRHLFRCLLLLLYPDLLCKQGYLISTAKRSEAKTQIIGNKATNKRKSMILKNRQVYIFHVGHLLLVFEPKESIQSSFLELYLIEDLNNRRDSFY